MEDRGLRIVGIALVDLPHRPFVGHDARQVVEPVGSPIEPLEGRYIRSLALCRGSGGTTGWPLGTDSAVDSVEWAGVGPAAVVDDEDEENLRLC